MSINYPTSLDSLTNPSSSNSLSYPGHSSQHSNANDAIEALEAKVGIDSSADIGSIDYRIGQLEANNMGVNTGDQDLTTLVPKSTPNAQTGTTYQFVLTDAYKLVILTNASPVAVTVPLNSTVTFPIGTQIDCIQGGAGKVTFAGEGGVVINSVSSYKSISAQNIGVSLVKTATDTWYLVGSLIA